MQVAPTHKQSLLKGIFGWLETFAVLIHVLDIFLGVAGLSLVAVFIAIFKLIPSDKIYFWPLLFLLLFTSCLLIIVFLLRNIFALRRHSRELNAHVIEEFRSVSLTVGKRHSKQKLSLHLRALEPCIQHYWIQFKWTGSEIAKLTLKSQQAQLLGPIPRMIT